jgi:hypothetical protein
LARASTVKWTEQGAYLDGIDGPQAPALREEGTAEMLDGLARYLTVQPASLPGTDDFRAAVASGALATGHTRRGHASAAALGQARPPSKHGPQTTRDHGSSDHAEADSDSVQLLARRPSRRRGHRVWKFCFGLPENREPDDPAQLDFLQSAYAHIMGRTAYESIAEAMTTATDHPFAPILNAGRKVIFSRTLKAANWANTTIAAGDTAEEINKLRQGGDGYIVSGAASASGGRSCGST